PSRPRTRRSGSGRRSSRSRASRRGGRASRGGSTPATASCCRRRPGARTTAPSRTSTATGRSRGRRSRRRSRRTSTRRLRRRLLRRPTLRRLLLRRLRSADLLAEPLRDTRWAERLRVDARMPRPAIGDRLAVPLDHVLVAKPGAADVHAARVHGQPVVEVRRPDVADVCLDRHRLHAVVAERLVAVPEPVEVVDARDLEPDEVVRDVGDPLRVGLGEPHAGRGVEVEAVGGETLSVSLERLAELVRERGPAVVLTGAGISTESGIPDFRSPTGIWAQYDPEEYATIQAFRADPVKVWSFYSLRYGALTDANPNAGHEALAELERLGHVRAVVTQNIDCLHERAGSRDVVEVHGSIRTCSCPACGQRYPRDEVLAQTAEGAAAPRGEDDGPVLKPDVVFFGELLPAAAIDRAYELARTTRLMLVV